VKLFRTRPRAAAVTTKRRASTSTRSTAFVRRLSRRLLIGLALGALAVPAEAAAFRFAWLSDTHIGSETAADDLRASVRDINATPDLRFVIVSGDVTEYGSLEQFRLAKQILSGLNIPCHLVPGNHDCKWSESGATDFARVFGADRFQFEYGGYRFLGLHQGPVMKMGDGHWAPQDVRWLEETLAKLPDKNQPLVFVTHYPLDDGIANWYVVLDRLKRYNTQVVLCGHGHANKPFDFEGVPGVMGRSNLRARQPAGGFNLVEVNDGRMSFAEHVAGGETRPAWHRVALARHDYAADTNRYPRPDFSVNARYPNVRERWQFDTGWTIASTPALWQDTAIVGDASGTVYCLALASGQVRWKFKTQGAVYSTPDAANGRAVFASTDGNVYALDAADGKERWRYRTDRAIVACPRIVNDTVYLGSSEGKFRALNLADGQLRWQFDHLQGFVETRPLVQDGRVIFGAWDGCLYALDAQTGARLWKWRGDHPATLFSPAACWPVAAHGKVFIAAPDRYLTALDAQTGRTVWRTRDYAARESLGLSADGERLYVRGLNNFLHALATAADTPPRVWELDAGFGYDINSAMLVEKDGVVFYGTKNSLLLAVDGKTGALRWQHKTGVGVMNTVLPLNAREVLTTDFDGKVTLVSARE
jgi:outer membrane protein assembly factor BamB/predicted phosphodiesterase